MRFGSLMKQLLLLLLTVSGTNAFAYSCEEVKYQLINQLLKKEAQTTYACVVAQEGYSNWGQLSKIVVEEATLAHHLDKMATSTTHCVTRQPWSNEQWRVIAPKDLDLDCTQKFTLFFTSDDNAVYAPVKQTNSTKLWNDAATLVVPQTGMKIKKKSCTGTGVVTVYGGAGKSLNEELYTLGDWKCSQVPDWILTFDSVIEIGADFDISFEFEYSSALTVDSIVTANNGDRIIVFTNGRADDVQNVQGGIEHRACIQLANAIPTIVTVNMELTFDSANKGEVVLQKIYHGSDYDYYNGTYTEMFNTEYFEVRYVPTGKQPKDIGTSNDDIFMDITIGSNVPAPPATTRPPTPTTTSSIPAVITTPSPASTGNGEYCNCEVDKFGFSNGWNYNDIWLDIVVILDTSEAMGAQALEDAQELIESFISDGVVDFLITDSTAPFYTRVGVIKMSETAEVLYNLNMTKSDTIQASIKKGLAEININQAFDAANAMLSGGLKSKPDRSTTRQVIYYMTDSDPKTSQDSLNKFKEEGVIIVNNFLADGEVARAGLKSLASDGYYYSSINYLKELQIFCKANCFCKPDKSAYGGSDPATKASGGCYHPVTAGVPFNKAKTACTNGMGIIATVHDEQKGQFVQQLMSNSKSDYFWIGYEKSSTGSWQWEDQSTDPFTNWDVNEPSSAAVAKCAYVDATTAKWGAGNSQLGFPYVCQYEPCSVGNKEC